MKIIKRKIKGFTLVELILTLAVISAISFMAFSQMLKNYETNQAQSAGNQIKDIGMAVNNYIVNHYDVLSQLQNSPGTGSDLGPRTCDIASQSCSIGINTLLREGLLSPSFSGKNVYGSDYTISIKRSGVAPYWSISALTTTNQPLKLDNKIRYDLLGNAMQVAGTDSGMTRNTANKVDGFKGSWNANQAEYSNIKQLGQLAYLSGYGSNAYSAFLRRDGSLPMTGDLNMGTKNIYGAVNITASGRGSFGGEVQAGSWIRAKNGYGEQISLGGDAAANDYELKLSSNKPLSINSTAGKANVNITGSLTTGQALSVGTDISIAGNSTVGKDMSIKGLIATNGLNARDLPAGWGGGLRTNDVYAGGTIAAGTGKQVNAYLNSAGDIRANRNISVGGMITASGNINTTADMNSNRLYSNYIKSNGSIDATGRLNTNEYLYIGGNAVVGNNCSPNGLQGRNANGLLLSCVSGKWQGLGSGFFKAPPPQTIQCSAKNYKLTKTFMARIDESGQLYSRYYNNAGTDTGWAKGTANAQIDFTGVSGSNSRTVQGGGQSESTSTVSCQGKWVWN